jgi:hypothetical protein
LRHVNDNAFSYNGGYRDWTWRTNGYTIAQINSLFQWGADHYTTGGSNSFMKSVKTTVGTVTSLTIYKDGSNRVKKVTVIGTNGQKDMAGWLFKALWNSWVANVKPSGQTDYIYSISFSFATN